MKVSIIVPTKNEEKNIKEILDKAKKFGEEILVVDGHSTDKTPDIVQATGVKLIEDQGLGKGEALRRAIKETSADIMVFIDADGSHNSEDIPKLIEPIKDNQADLVIASRRTGGSDELYGDLNKFFRELGSNIITLLINHHFKTAVTDSQNGFRAIKASLAKELDLKENITTIEQEMLIKVLRKGGRVTEIPSHENKRKYGCSVIKLSKVWWRYIYSCLKYLYFYS
ncbi:MAG: glycosyltransferase family 2 protein [Patescibacteria group bacterium]